MSLVSATQIGQIWKWGFGAADAPAIGNGFHPTDGEVRYGPEVYSTSQDGEGHVDSVTVSKADKRKWECTFKGRIDDSFDPTAFPVSFTWQSRRHIIKPGGIGRAMPKGEYHEVSIETESFGGVS
ncbi:MAG: hypothetical protein QOE70_1420 [Chthoniobacter sp.]|jgi:hypothetical protein|nr:hypothetical protein [Chthoniobacter sp.]